MLTNLTVGERVKRLAQLNGLSQKDVSKKLHVTSGAISQKYKGTINFSIQDLISLSELLGVSVDFLLGREEAHR